MMVRGVGLSPGWRDTAQVSNTPRRTACTERFFHVTMAAVPITAGTSPGGTFVFEALRSITYRNCNFFSGQRILLLFFPKPLPTRKKTTKCCTCTSKCFSSKCSSRLILCFSATARTTSIPSSWCLCATPSGSPCYSPWRRPCQSAESSKQRLPRCGASRCLGSSRSRSTRCS